jgi:hypothetical protein
MKKTKYETKNDGIRQKFMLVFSLQEGNPPMNRSRPTEPERKKAVSTPAILQ